MMMVVMVRMNMKEKKMLVMKAIMIMMAMTTMR